MSNTAQITLNNGNKINAVIGSPLYNTYKHTVTSSPMTQQQQTQHNMSNNAQRAQQNYQQWSQPQQSKQSYQTIQPQQSSSSYSQPTQSVSSPSTGVSSISSSNQYQSNATPSSNITGMLNNLKTMETQLSSMFKDKSVNGDTYNNTFSQRNKLSASILDEISKENKGNISLKDLEVLYGRRIENQEFQAYRDSYTPQNQLELSQLNNLWEHDFATRNNGEHYGFVQNYLNGDANAPIAQTLKDWLGSQTDAERQAYLASMQSSQQATQDYATKRETGYTPQYVNNTYNPAPWGPVDAGDVINDGGKKLNDAMEYYLKYGLSPYDPRNPFEQQQQQAQPQMGNMNQYEQMLMQQQSAMEQMIKDMQQENAYKQSQGAGQAPVSTSPKDNGKHIYNPGQTANGVGYTDNQVVDSQILSQYLDKILKGGF